jgi:hypothetical protein
MQIPKLTIAGLKAARNQMIKRHDKERQRAASLRIRVTELEEEIQVLKTKIAFLTDRYIL